MPALLTNLALRAINSTSDLPPSGDPTNQRSLWDILWSCVVTMFACTWIAVHPNIPAVDDTLAVVAFRRVGLMLCGLIAPEIIILWAMRQWYSARKIGQAHRDKGWTTTHGFFLQMGGFVMHNRGNPPYPIPLDELVAMHNKGEIDWPKITEVEILDKSKGDALSKGMVILQTSWFLVQCICRGARGLAITELELVTLAFAALNTVTYFFWWNKPADVRCPHPVYPKRHVSQLTHPTPESWGGSSLVEQWSRCIRFIRAWLVKPTIPRIYKIHQRGLLWPLWFSLLRSVVFLMKLFVNVVLPITGGVNNLTSMKRVPTFYAARSESNPAIFFSMTLTCALIGSVFGGIHCIAWSFQFSSHTHQMLWRASSLVITCTPLIIALASTHMSHHHRIFKQTITPLKYRTPTSPIHQPSVESSAPLEAQQPSLSIDPPTNHWHTQSRHSTQDYPSFASTQTEASYKLVPRRRQLVHASISPSEVSIAPPEFYRQSSPPIDYPQSRSSISNYPSSTPQTQTSYELGVLDCQVYKSPGITSTVRPIYWLVYRLPAIEIFDPRLLTHCSTNRSPNPNII